MMKLNLMNFRFNGLGAVAALTLGLAAAGNAQTVTIASVQGGSSALLGNFAVSSFSEGAIPKVIAATTLGITNYKNANQTDNKFLATNIVVTDGTTTETVSTAEIRYNLIAANDIRVIILLRSDSGFGVRYVANRFYVKSWGGFTKTDGTAISGNETLVANYLTTNANTGASGVEAVKTGLSDVSADTIVRYANFPNLSTSGLSGVVVRRLAVQTLLPIYNGSLSPSAQINFSRADIQGLIKGTTPRPYGITSVFYREQTSGTRNTQIVDSQVNYPGSTTGTPPRLAYSAESGGTVNTSTGAILSSIDSVADSFSYAFVTGGAGNGKANIRVGKYKGFTPYANSTTNAYLSLPGNNGQTAYSTSTTPYYTGVTAGTYTLWSYALSYSVPSGDATADDIQSELNSSTNRGLVNSLGLIQPTQLNSAAPLGFNIDRSSYTSPYTGEQVTDGQTVGSASTRSHNLSFPGQPQP